MERNTRHVYAAALAWEGNRASGTSTYDAYGRQFRATIAGKGDVIGSADPAFLGDPALWSPEDLLLVAIASCHMLTYCALAARRGVRILRYRDDARGVMTLDRDVGGAFREVTLRPQVVVGTAADVGLAHDLHAEAARLCFIGRSCNFPIGHAPTIVVEGGER